MTLTLAVDGGILRRDFETAGDQAAEQFVRRTCMYANTQKLDRFVVAFDSSESFRRELFPEYKADRPPTPEGLPDQLELAKEQFESAGAEIVEIEGFEADDVIASLAAGEGRTIIVSPDKDLRQCLEKGRVTIARKLWLSYGALAVTYLTTVQLLEQTGIRPDQWIEYQMLVGDPTDGIQGAKGIGKKTATDLLKTYGDIGSIIHWAWDFSVNRRDSLFEFSERMDLVRQLVTLRTDLFETAKA